MGNLMNLFAVSKTTWHPVTLEPSHLDTQNEGLQHQPVALQVI